MSNVINVPKSMNLGIWSFFKQKVLKFENRVKNFHRSRRGQGWKGWIVCVGEFIDCLLIVVLYGISLTILKKKYFSVVRLNQLIYLLFTDSKHLILHWHSKFLSEPISKCVIFIVWLCFGIQIHCLTSLLLFLESGDNCWYW